MSEIDHNAEYRSYIQNLAANSSPTTFFYEGQEHSVIVMTTIIKSALNNLYIFAGNLCKGIASNNEYYSALKEYLEKGGNLYIILNDFKIEDITLGNKILFDLIDHYRFYYPEKISLKKTGEKIMLERTKMEIHFCIADGKIYRVEEDVKTFKSLGSFNDSDYVSLLMEAFEFLKNSPSTEDIKLT